MALAEDLVRRVCDHGAVLAGSLLAVPVERREEAAHALTARNIWVHADVIDGRFGSRPSVSLDTIAVIAAIPGARVDVHLMVDDVLDWLLRLPEGLNRVTIQEPDEGLSDFEIASARAKAAEVWLAVVPERSERPLPARVDGLLVMLTPPGQSGHSLDHSALEVVSALTASQKRPVGVDGGITVGTAAHALDAGALYLVSGRGLFEQSEDDRGDPRPSNDCSEGGGERSSR